MKAGAQIIQQKGRPIPIHLHDQVAQELKRLIKHGYVERATETTKNCFVSPAVLTVKKGQIDKNRTRFQKIKRNYREAKGTIAENGRIDITDFKEDI